MEVLMGKSFINGPFSMAMLNNQRVILWYFIGCVWIYIGYPKIQSLIITFPSWVLNGQPVCIIHRKLQDSKNHVSKTMARNEVYDFSIKKHMSFSRLAWNSVSFNCQKHSGFSHPWRVIAGSGVWNGWRWPRATGRS
jgi:hypothetical protein